MIRLVGPGGAGKTTVGRALATRLGVAFADLDEQFRQEFGDISAFLNAEGYGAYCTRNIQSTSRSFAKHHMTECSHCHPGS